MCGRESLGHRLFRMLLKAVTEIQVKSAFKKKKSGSGIFIHRSSKAGRQGLFIQIPWSLPDYILVLCHPYPLKCFGNRSAQPASLTSPQKKLCFFPCHLFNHQGNPFQKVPSRLPLISLVRTAFSAHA